MRKYNEKGIEGLVDKPGKRKAESEMTEAEKLRAENRILEARNRRLKTENAVLKNSRNYICVRKMHEDGYAITETCDILNLNRFYRLVHIVGLLAVICRKRPAYQRSKPEVTAHQ